MTTSEPQVAGDGETTGAGGGADLHLVVAAQAELIDQLQHRLERLEGERGVPAAAATTPVAPTAPRRPPRVWTPRRAAET